MPTLLPWCLPSMLAGSLPGRVDIEVVEVAGDGLGFVGAGGAELPEFLAAPVLGGLGPAVEINSNRLKLAISVGAVPDILRTARRARTLIAGLVPSPRSAASRMDKW